MKDNNKEIISINVRSFNQPDYKALAKQLVRRFKSHKRRCIDLSNFSNDNQTINIVEVFFVDQKNSGKES